MRATDLQRLFEPYGASLDEAAASTLAQYLALLSRWSKRVNLTGHKDPKVAAEKLLIDGVPVAELVAASAGVRSVADVGAGGGALAGVVHCRWPDVEVHAIEPRTKRAVFLRTVRRELGLSRFHVHQGRVEEGSLPDDLEPVDAIYAQAVMPPDRWLPLARTLVRPGGVILCLTSAPLSDDKVLAGFVVQAERVYELPSGVPRVVTALKSSP